MKANHPFQIKGKNNRFIQSALWQNEIASNKIAVLFGGFAYSTEAPLMYYLRGLLAYKDFDVLTIDCRYNENFEYLQMSIVDKEMYANEEAKIISEQLNAILKYEDYVFAAKSAGTSTLIEMILSGLIDNLIEKSRIIWLTPAGRNAEIIEYIKESSIRSLYIACENDSYLDEVLIESLYECSNAECMIVPEAGHSFEKSGDISGSIDNIKSVIQFIENNI